MSIIPAMMAMGPKPVSVMASTMPFDAPEKVRICANVVAPMMIRRIIPEIAIVPRSDFISAATESAR